MHAILLCPSRGPVDVSGQGLCKEVRLWKIIDPLPEQRANQPWQISNVTHDRIEGNRVGQALGVWGRRLFFFFSNSKQAVGQYSTYPSFSTMARTMSSNRSVLWGICTQEYHFRNWHSGFRCRRDYVLSRKVGMMIMRGHWAWSEAPEARNQVQWNQWDGGFWGVPNKSVKSWKRNCMAQ